MPDASSPSTSQRTSHLLPPDQAAEIRTTAQEWPHWSLTLRQTRDLELIVTGTCSPLTTFMGQEDHESVLASMRLKDGTLHPMPVTLDLEEAFAEKIGPGDPIALVDGEGILLATLQVEELWKPDRLAEAKALYGTDRPDHMGVVRLMKLTHPVYCTGKLTPVRLPVHYDFRSLRPLPRELHERFREQKWKEVLAYSPSGPMTWREIESTQACMKKHDAGLLLQPLDGVVKRGDIDHFMRIRCARAAMTKYPEASVELGLLPLATRQAGPREALWKAMLQRNCGATHVMEADQAAFEMIREHADELQIVPHKLPDPDQAEFANMQKRIDMGKELPESFTPAVIAREITRYHPLRKDRGFTVFFTGLPSCGKSTLANVLVSRMLERGGRPVSLLDGDLVRKHLSSELGFSKEHRDLNIRRIGYVAAEITQHRGIAVCAPIAPYDTSRREIREMIEAFGGFYLVHVSTPLEVCEARDRKGLYAKARAGLVKEFTGISDPYETPEDAELRIDTSNLSSEEGVKVILDRLVNDGYLE